MTSTSYDIQGRRVDMPCEVRDAASGAATFWVPAAPAQRLVPEPFRVAELWPGRTLLSLAAIDYRDNDLGDYNEVSVTFFVRAPGEPAGLPYLGNAIDFFRQRLGTYILALPVDQSFTCEAGCTIWGFPKTVEEIDIAYASDHASCRLAMDGQHVLTLTLPRDPKASGTLPEREMVTYTQIAGVPHRTRSRMGGSGFKAGGGGGIRLELGTHPLARTLRELGLPKKALLGMWTEHMRATFEAPGKLESR